jgi:hypothetical protein
MKKPKKPIGFDEKPDPLQDIDIEFTGDDDDEIIDLEDIIEMPSRSINEDEDLDLDIEILDADSDFDFDAEIAKSGGKPAPKEPPMEDFSPELTKEDDAELFKSLGEESEDEDDLFGLLEAGEKKEIPADEDDPFGILAAVEAEKKPAPTKPEDEEDPFGILAALDSAGKSEAAEEPGLIEDKDEDLLKDLDNLLASPQTDVPEPEVTPAIPEDIEPETTEPAAPPSVPAAEVTAPQAVDFQVEAFVDELVGRIEAGLMETVRAIVEARLPDVVREIIREEIEKIKEELK